MHTHGLSATHCPWAIHKQNSHSVTSAIKVTLYMAYMPQLQHRRICQHLQCVYSICISIQNLQMGLSQWCALCQIPRMCSAVVRLKTRSYISGYLGLEVDAQLQLFRECSTGLAYATCDVEAHTVCAVWKKLCEDILMDGKWTPGTFWWISSIFYSAV